MHCYWTYCGLGTYADCSLLCYIPDCSLPPLEGLDSWERSFLLTHIIYVKHHSNIPFKTKQTLHLPLGWKEKTQTKEGKISAEHLWRLFLYLLCLSVKKERKIKFCGFRKKYFKGRRQGKEMLHSQNHHRAMFNIPVMQRLLPFFLASVIFQHVLLLTT